MKTYELTYIVSPTVSQEEVESVQKEIESTIQAGQGVILKSDKMGARNLSYPVKKQISGYLTTIVFQLTEDKLKEVKTKLDQEKKIIRNITVIKRPEKEMKARSMRRYSLRPEMKRPVFAGGIEESRKADKVEVKEEEVSKKLDEILSE